MKFRIVEIKRKYERNFFRPEYKSFLFWRNVADTQWTETIFVIINLIVGDMGVWKAKVKQKIV